MKRRLNDNGGLAKRLAVALPEYLMEWVEAEAKRRNVSMAKVIRSCVARSAYQAPVTITTKPDTHRLTLPKLIEEEPMLTAEDIAIDRATSPGRLARAEAALVEAREAIVKLK